MNAFLKYLLIFIFAILAIVFALMIYEYIKICYWGEILERNATIEHCNNLEVE